MLDDSEVGSLLERIETEGALVTAGDEKCNTMSASWCALGKFWGKKMLIVPIRKKRYTYELIKENGCFSVSVPFRNIRLLMNIFGTKSGRDIDKYKLAQIDVHSCKKIDCKIPYINGAHFECKIIYEMEMDLDKLDKSLKKLYYNGDDEHTLFFGEIVESYKV